MQQHVERLGVDLHEGFLFGDHAFVDKVAGYLDGGSGGTLAVTGLEHVQLIVLDGELHILHISVVILENIADLLELGKGSRELVLHLVDRHRSTDTCNDVLALCIGQELAHEALFTGSGVTGKRNTGAAVVAHITERHHLDVNSSTPGVGDIVVHTVDICAGVVPGTEHGLDSLEQLLLGIVGEVLAELVLILGLELISQLLKVVGIQLDVKCDALFFLHLVDELLEILLADFHNDVGEHLYESAVAVPSPAGVVGLLCDNVYHVFIKTEVENGVHHAGHGSAGTGTYRNEQGVVQVTELLAGDLLHFFDVLHDFGHDIGVDLTAVLIVFGAGLGGNGKALRNRKTYIGHFGEVGALAAEDLAHFCVTFGKKVAVFFGHLVNTSVYNIIVDNFMSRRSRPCFRVRLKVYYSILFSKLP